MKNIYLTRSRHILLLFGLFVICWQGAQAQVKIGVSASTDNLNQGATLEVESGPYPGNIYRGFLPPRVALTDYATWTLTGTPTDGMMVYNTVTTTGNYPVTPGIYYWYNNQWNKVITAVNPAIISSLDCQPSVAPTGIYKTSVPINFANNKKLITVVPASAGAYSAGTQSKNGYSFATLGLQQGTFFTPDQVGKPQTFTLSAQGTPQTSGTDTFTVSSGAQSCTFTTTVINYLDCGTPPTGTYKVNVPLDASNIKQIIFTPQAAGTNNFDIYFFVGAAVVFRFVADNVTFTDDQIGVPQTITLKGSGTPPSAGTFYSEIQINGPSINPNSASCPVTVTVVP